jgi:hypothetical protein
MATSTGFVKVDKDGEDTVSRTKSRFSSFPVMSGSAVGKCQMPIIAPALRGLCAFGQHFCRGRCFTS